MRDCVVQKYLLLRLLLGCGSTKAVGVWRPQLAAKMLAPCSPPSLSFSFCLVSVSLATLELAVTSGTAAKLSAGRQFSVERDAKLC